MVSQLDIQNKASLESQGYTMERIGFEDHWIPMYAHHPVSDKKVGDVVFRARVGNPKTLNNAEANYLARKAAQGFFTWLPGQDCLSRKFQDATFQRRAGGGSTKMLGEVYQGCKWCREREQPASSPTSEREPVLEVVQVSPPPATPALLQEPAPSKYQCLYCDWKPLPGSSNQKQMLGQHNRRKHAPKASARRSAPANG